MSESVALARPYAKAVFEQAVADKALGTWREFLELAAAITINEDMQRALSDPRLSQQQKLSVYMDLCQSNSNPQRENFLKLLAEKHRLVVLPAILNQFAVLQDDYEKSQDVTVKTYLPLTTEQQASLQSSLENKLKRQVRLHFQEDKTLLGGVVIQAKDFVIDGSAKGKLSRLAEQMVS